MKKTMLALVVAATSFGAFASENVTPVNPNEYTAEVVASFLNSDKMKDILNITGETEFRIEYDVEGNPILYVNSKKGDKDAEASMYLDPELRNGFWDDQQLDTLIRHITRGVEENIEGRRNDVKEFLANNDIKNHERFDEWVTYRKNNESKYTFSPEQQLAAINKLSQSGNEFFIQEGKLVVKAGPNGETREITDEEIILAKQALKIEAAERADQHKDYNPVPNPGEDELMPIGYTPEERAKFEATVVQGAANAVETAKDNVKELDTAAKIAYINENGRGKVTITNNGDGTADISWGDVDANSSLTIDQDMIDEKAAQLADQKNKKQIERKEMFGGELTDEEKEQKLKDSGKALKDKIEEMDGEEVKEAMAELYAAGGNLTEASSMAADEIDAKFNWVESEIDRLDEKMDGVMASTQAVNAARPYLFNGQTSAVGVGIGAAGSEQAVAVGYAHRINENWSANANVSATSGNDTEVSAGAGVSFAW